MVAVLIHENSTQILEGYIEERLYRNKYAGFSVYTELTEKGCQVLAEGSKPKVYLHVNTDRSENTSLSDLLARTTVSETEALKERYMLKYGDVFTRCLKALTDVATQIAEESGLCGPYAILSQEGLEQVAALLPRTNSDLLQVDSMTFSKVEKYGARIMAALKPFWKEVDYRDEVEMRLQLEKLKDDQPAAPLPLAPWCRDRSSSPTTSSSEPREKGANRFHGYRKRRCSRRADDNSDGSKTYPRKRRYMN